MSTCKDCDNWSKGALAERAGLARAYGACGSPFAFPALGVFTWEDFPACDRFKPRVPHWSEKAAARIWTLCIQHSVPDFEGQSAKIIREEAEKAGVK